MAKMLILPGISGGPFPDERGKPKSYPNGALHEGAAVDYAKRRGYDAVVSKYAGDPGPNHDRSRSTQTIKAVELIDRDSDIEGLYGFSGGGYNVYWILQVLTDAALGRLKLVAVLGAEKRSKAQLEASAYKDKGGAWELVYQVDPPASASVVPRGVDPHMFGPEWLLSKTPVPAASPSTP